MDTRTDPLEHKLRLVQSMTALAYLAGGDPDEIRRRVEAGITHAIGMAATRPRVLPPAGLSGHPEPRAARTTALGTWVRRQPA